MTENQRTEYKRELTGSLEKEIVAFLNAREGGILYIGIDDTGKVIGVPDVDQVQLTIKDRLKNNIQPSIMGLFEILHQRHDKKDVIRITVAGGLEKPYYLKKYGMTRKGCFLRVGSAAEPMDREMIETFYGKRVRNTIGRMESPRRELTFEQLKIYYEARGLHLNDAFMKNLELLTPDNQPNYAAYLLADENGASFQIAKYAGSDRVDLIENRDYGRCSIIKALKSMLDRVDVENTIFTKITFPLRQELELFNSVAMREALINAVVHNDYSYGATPKIEFFFDRAEVTSMGGLPYGVTKADFFGGVSVPRNKEIMRIFRDLEIVEHLGSGVPRILKAYGKEAFEIRESYLRIILPYSAPSSDVSLTGNMVIAGKKSEHEGKQRVNDGVNDGVNELQLSETMVKIIRFLYTPASTPQLLKALDYPRRTRNYDSAMKQLLDAGMIEMTLPNSPRSKKQKYCLTANGRECWRKLTQKK